MVLVATGICAIFFITNGVHEAQGHAHLRGLAATAR
jgi:zinc and cadmium transporter